MDRHDEQFEVFLRQFKLRKPSPLPQIASLRHRSIVRWVFAAAAVLLSVGVLSTLVFQSGSTGVSAKATIEAAGNPSLYAVGQTIEAGKVVRSNSAVGLMLGLEDGSHIEMRSQSQLVLESSADGIRVRLNEGGILVTAAKQGAGHLYVQTRDAMVSVVGTVFFVSAEQSGTRVAVVEGEVHVQQGSELKKLLRGEQIATSPSMKLNPVAEQIAWSQRAAEYVALLTPVRAALLPIAPTSVAQTGRSPGSTGAEQRKQEGTRIFHIACGGCHSTDAATSSTYSTKDEYDSLVGRERVKGARVSDQQVPLLVDYLFETYGRKAVPPVPSVLQLIPLLGTQNPISPPSPKPEEKDPKKEDPDVAGARILNTACTTCHDLGPITQRAEDRASWESIVKGMVGYGADVKDVEISVLVDYLFKHYGPPKEAPKGPEPIPSDLPLQGVK